MANSYITYEENYVIFISQKTQGYFIAAVACNYKRLLYMYLNVATSRSKTAILPLQQTSKAIM